MISFCLFLSLLFSLACNSGTFGQECNDSCGRCLDQDGCYHTNGTCLTGCVPGYHGHLCKEGKPDD